MAEPVRTKRHAVGVVIVALALVFGACDREGTGAGTTGGDTAGDEGASEASAKESPRVVKSDDLPEEPTRIVSLAPNVTEMLFALGVGDRVVAVTKHCDYPSQVADLPSVGSFANPDFETIVSHEPDIVVGTSSGGSKEIFERLKGVDLPYTFVRTDTIEEALRGIETIGRVVGEPEAGNSLAEEVRGELIRARNQFASENRPRVLLVYGHDPLVAAGPETFGHELLAAVGARNVLGEADTPYPRLDIEKVVELSPDRILDTTMVENEEGESFWAAHEGIDAVDRGRVAYLTDPVVLRPGPRLPEALERIGEALYEEAAVEGSAP